MQPFAVVLFGIVMTVGFACAGYFARQGFAEIRELRETRVDDLKEFYAARTEDMKAFGEARAADLKDLLADRHADRLVAQKELDQHRIEDAERFGSAATRDNLHQLRSDVAKMQTETRVEMNSALTAIRGEMRRAQT